MLPVGCSSSRNDDNLLLSISNNDIIVYHNLTVAYKFIHYVSCIIDYLSSVKLNLPLCAQGLLSCLGF